VSKKGLALTFKGWRPESIPSINVPATVMLGDAEIVRPEHAVKMFRLLGGGVAAIAPASRAHRT